MVGDTDRLATPVTSPTPLSIERVVAPVVAHDKVADCPAVMVEGVEVKLLMVGDGTGGGATPELPPSPPPPQAASMDSMKTDIDRFRSLIGNPTRGRSAEQPCVSMH
ncbi:MAG: hypothetical protein ACKO9D_12160 [Gammaproteobacteria bacterium]